MVSERSLLACTVLQTMIITGCTQTEHFRFCIGRIDEIVRTHNYTIKAEAKLASSSSMRAEADKIGFVSDPKLVPRIRQVVVEHVILGARNS